MSSNTSGTTTPPTDIDSLINVVQQWVTTTQTALNQSTSNADSQNRGVGTGKKLKTDLDKAKKDLPTARAAGQLRLRTGNTFYTEAEKTLKEVQKFADYDTLKQVVFEVDTNIEKLRQDWEKAKDAKTTADATLATAKTDETALRAKLDVAYGKLSNLPKTIQDKRSEVETQQAAVETALGGADLVASGIALATYRVLLGDNTLPPTLPSLTWAVADATVAKYIGEIDTALTQYMGALTKTATETLNANQKAADLAAAESQHKAAIASRVADITAKFETTRAAQAAAAQAAASQSHNDTTSVHEVEAPSSGHDDQTEA